MSFGITTVPPIPFVMPVMTPLQMNITVSPVQKIQWQNGMIIFQPLLPPPAVPGVFGPIGESWLPFFHNEFAKLYFAQLCQNVIAASQQHQVYPPLLEVFNWTRLCHFDTVKVVIIGQDPYLGKKQAHGLAFSVNFGVPIPPSLSNIFKELENENIGFQRPGHGCLIGWAEQGVLLLNLVLTVQEGIANSHKDMGWQTLTHAVISYLNQNKTGLVFMLWGVKAQSIKSLIDEKKHLVLTAPHPSPLSAYTGFFGCNHFSQCNQYLSKNGQTTIMWLLPPLPQ